MLDSGWTEENSRLQDTFLNRVSEQSYILRTILIKTEQNITIPVGSSPAELSFSQRLLESLLRAGLLDTTERQRPISCSSPQPDLEHRTRLPPPISLVLAVCCFELSFHPLIEPVLIPTTSIKYLIGVALLPFILSAVTLLAVLHLDKVGLCTSTSLRGRVLTSLPPDPPPKIKNRYMKYRMRNNFVDRLKTSRWHRGQIKTTTSVNRQRKIITLDRISIFHKYESIKFWGSILRKNQPKLSSTFLAYPHQPFGFSFTQMSKITKPSQNANTNYNSSTMDDERNTMQLPKDVQQISQKKIKKERHCKGKRKLTLVIERLFDSVPTILDV